MDDHLFAVKHAFIVSHRLRFDSSKAPVPRNAPIKGGQAFISVVTSMQEATNVIREERELLKEVVKGLTNGQAQACRHVAPLIMGKIPANGSIPVIPDHTGVPTNPDGGFQGPDMTAGVLDYLRDLTDTAKKIDWYIVFGLVMSAIGLFTQVSKTIANIVWHVDEEKECPVHKDKKCSCPPQE